MYIYIYISASLNIKKKNIYKIQNILFFLCYFSWYVIIILNSLTFSDTEFYLNTREYGLI